MSGERDSGVRERRAAASGGSAAGSVAAGIFLSRVAGFVREMALAAVFGVGPHADVFRTALRGPNLLQNLLGEQVLSASFIPVYSRFLARGSREDARRFAGAVFGLLLAAAGTLALVGVVGARPVVALLAPGYLKDAAGGVDRFALTVRAVHFIFPMTGVLVLSAWALGVLNSHRRFFLSYVAPVLWNGAIVAALAWAVLAASGPWQDSLDQLLIAACVGALLGGILQFGIQLPAALRCLGGLRPSLDRGAPGVKEALRAFAPVVAARGVVQLSGYLDIVLASLLAEGAVGALLLAQTLYLLPVSLFGSSVAAAELPELAQRHETGSVAGLAERIRAASRRSAYLTVPTAIGYLAFGFLIVGALFRRGAFGLLDNWLVYIILCGYALGIVATNLSRLLVNTFYSLGEARVPARTAVVRVTCSAGLGALLMLRLDGYAVGDLVAVRGSESLYLGALGLALAGGAAAWLELGLLLRRLRARLPEVVLPWRAMGAMAVAAGGAVLPAVAVWKALPPLSPWLAALPVVAVYGGLYLGICHWWGLGSLADWVTVRRRRS